MAAELQKMLAGDPYDPIDSDLVAAREHARDLCQALNATRETEQEQRRSILQDLFGAPPAIHAAESARSRNERLRGMMIHVMVAGSSPAKSEPALTSA